MKQQSKKNKIQVKAEYQQKQNIKQQHQQTQPITKIPKNKLQKMPTIDMMLRIPQAQRLSKANKYFDQIKPFLVSYMQKKEGSRVMQLMFKWGSHATKGTIYQGVLKNWKDLIKSKYALYVIAKVSKLYDLPGLVEDFIILQSTREGAQILQNFIDKNPETEVVHKLKNKFFELSQIGDLKSEQTLHNLSQKIIQKSYYHFTLSKIILRVSLATMFDEQKEKAKETLINNIAPLVNDEEGVRLFIELVNLSNSKQKKQLLKTYKGSLEQIVSSSNLSYVTVMKLMVQIDDVVTVGKMLVSQLVQLLPLICENKKVYSIIFSLLSPRNNNYNVLGKYESEVKTTQCKKPQQTRKKQIRTYLYEPLINYITSDPQNLTKILKHHQVSKLILGLSKSLHEDYNPSYKPFIIAIAKHYLTDTKKAIKQNKFNQSIVADQNGNKIIKNLLILQQEFIDYYCDQFLKMMAGAMQSFLTCKASYVVLALLEKGGRDQLLAEVKRAGLKNDQIVGGPLFAKLMKK